MNGAMNERAMTPAGSDIRVKRAMRKRTNRSSFASGGRYNFPLTERKTKTTTRIEIISEQGEREIALCNGQWLFEGSKRTSLYSEEGEEDRN